MSNKVLTALSAALAITLVGCASTDPTTGATRNEVISVQYGRVENVQQVAMAPNYGAGALIGGALGLLATATHSGASQVAGAAAGAGLGALISKETAGSAEKFTVRLVNNSTIDIVTENQDIQLGDCASVEQGQHANIRRVSSVMCSTPASDPAYPSINASAVKESQECQEVKRELLNATTEQATSIAYKKMQAFCQS
jgi:outer membrane lipoprotein SlyB